MIGLLDRARVDRAVASLEALNEAVAQFDEDVSRSPSALSHLAEPITSAQQSSCGTAYPPGVANRWAGPYLSRVIPATGIPIAVGTILPQMERVNEGPASTLRFTIPDVAQEDAIEVERRMDGDGNGLAGAIRYTGPDARGLVTLFYHLPVRGC